MRLEDTSSAPELQGEKVVGHPGAAQGVSPSQAARISVFLVPEVVIEITAMAVPAGLAPASDTVDNRAPRRLRLRNPWLGCDKWWELVVMLHASPSGMFSDGRFTVG